MPRGGGGAVVGAVDDPRIAGLLHGWDRVLADAGETRIAEEAVVLTRGQIVSLLHR